MHIFISYGHDANTPIVDRIEADLRAANHTTWRDTDGIKSGDAWRQRIIEGLRTTDWVLAFLSKHATRNPGVCRDEIAIALGMKGGAISTVLLEPSGQVDPPPQVSDTQWVDMADWATRQAGDPATFETWYQAKFAEIAGIFSDPDNIRYADDIRELTARLKPEPQGADILPLIQGFVGREWLLKRVLAWRNDPDRTHLFWLAGRPGQGKSAFAAWIAHYHRADVIALNLCRFGVDHRNDPRHVLRTLAFQIATRLPEYRGELLTLLRDRDPDGAEMARRGPADLFHFLLLQRLDRIDGGRHRQPFLIVIDGLDETMRTIDGVRRSELAELLAQEAEALPRWIGVLATGRPESPLEPLFALQYRLVIDDEADRNTDDLRDYAQAWLGRAKPGLVDRIVQAAQGNFAYVTALRKAVTAGRIDLQRDSDLPRGLFALYHRWFARQFPDQARYDADIRPVLSVLATAGGPVPEATLADLFGWNVPRKLAIKAALGSLFVWPESGVVPFHLTLRDWLTDEGALDGPGERFVVDLTGGRERLRRYLWDRFVGAAKDRDGDALDAFALAELPRLLATRKDRDLAADIAAAGGLQGLAVHAAALAEAVEKSFAWTLALAWWGLTARLAAAMGDEGLAWRAYALARSGDVHTTLGDTQPTLATTRAALSIYQRLAAADPGNARWQRDLSISHNKIGDVLVAQGNLPDALAAYRAGMAIRERLAVADSGNAEWQRDLSVSHERIGNVLVAQGNLPDALAAYRAGMAIAERLAAADPGNAQ
jgi:hypothetical protein